MADGEKTLWHQGETKPTRQEGGYGAASERYAKKTIGELGGVLDMFRQGTPQQANPYSDLSRGELRALYTNVRGTASASLSLDEQAQLDRMIASMDGQ